MGKFFKNFILGRRGRITHKLNNLIYLKINLKLTNYLILKSLNSCTNEVKLTLTLN